MPTSDTVGGVSTGNVADLPISFHNLPLTALSDPAMQELFEAVTDTPLANLTLEGSANVTAKTTIGNVPIASIPFNVQSSLAGMLLVPHLFNYFPNALSKAWTASEPSLLQ